jgi:hypothetical protein
LLPCHAQTHNLKIMHMRMFAPVPSPPQTHTCTPAHPHAHRYAHARLRPRAHTRAPARARAHTHTHTQTHTRACARARVRAHAAAHMHKYRHNTHGHALAQEHCAQHSVTANRRITVSQGSKRVSFTFLLRRQTPRSFLRGGHTFSITQLMGQISGSHLAVVCMFLTQCGGSGLLRSQKASGTLALTGQVG